MYKNLLRVVSYLREHKKSYITGMAFSSIELFIAFITPYLYKQLIYIVTNDTQNAAMRTVIILFALLIILTPFAAYGYYLKQRAATHCAANLRNDLLNHILRLPPAKLLQGERATGDYIQRLSGDVTAATGFLQGYTSVSAVKVVVYTIVPLVILIRVNIFFALFGLALGFLSTFFSTAMKRPFAV